MQRILQRWLPGMALAACLSSGVFAAPSPTPAKSTSPEKPSVVRLLVINVAEPPSVAILAVDLIAAAGLIWVFRRRLAGQSK